MLFDAASASSMKLAARLIVAGTVEFMPEHCYPTRGVAPAPAPSDSMMQKGPRCVRRYAPQLW